MIQFTTGFFSHKLRKKKKDQQEIKRWTTNCTMRCKITYIHTTGK